MVIVLQDGIKDCGICSLLSIIRYYGGEVSKEYLREMTNTTKSGVTAYKLIEAAENIGFEAVGMNGKLEYIEKNNLPCISHVIISKSYQHFIVIYDIDFKKEKILVMDPARGKRILTFSEFKLMTSNNYIFLHPIKKLPIISEKKIIKTTIKLFLKENKRYIPFITFLTFSYFIFTVLTAFHFKYLTEYAINYNIDYNILKVSIIVLIIYIFKEITALLRNILLIKWGEMFDDTMTQKTYTQIILLPYFYYKNRTTGEVISRIKDLSTVKGFISKLICSLTTDLMTIFVFIIIMFNLNKKLFVFSILTILLIIFPSYILTKIKKRKLVKYYKQEDKVNNFLIESLASVDAVKGMHIENEIINKFKLKYKRLLESTYDLSLIESIESFTKNIIMNIILVIVFGFGAKFVINNEMSIGELFIYQSFLNYYLCSVMNIVNIKKDYNELKVSLNRIEDLFNINKENFEGGGYYNVCNLNGDIKFNNLDYAYNSKKIFNNLYLEIKRGTNILLCGPSGSGKSTLVKILMRYIEIPFGKLNINNIDINHYHLDNLRNNITYVSQQDFLFTNTIYNNIVMDRNIDEKKLKKILRITLVDEIIERNNLKYQCLVEENGFNFSGGERQKIILARSLLKNSDIYIFDEALSQIDIDGERSILINIFKYLKNKTIIVISHRFNNQDIFDRVININKGKINEIKV